MQKIATVGIFALVAMLLLATTMTSFNAVDAKKPVKPVKCQNVKVQVRVSNAVNGTAYTANVTLDGVTKSKTSTAEENGTLALPVNFKKLNPCPSVGDAFNGDVNGVPFDGSLKSLKKPNKISVTIP